MTAPRSDIVLAELTRLLTRICEHDQSGLSQSVKIEDIPGIDSLRVLQAIAHLEEEFQVEVEIEALGRLIVVRDILDAICRARPMA